MPNIELFDVDKLPVYIKLNAQPMRMRAFKKELKLIRQLSQSYDFPEETVKRPNHPSGFRFYIAVALDWFRTVLNLKVNIAHPEFIELGMRLAHLIAHPLHTNKKMLRLKGMLARYYPCFMVNSSLKKVVMEDKLDLNPHSASETGTVKVAVAPPPTKQALSHVNDESTASAYSTHLTESTIEAKRIKQIVETACLLDAAHKETACSEQFQYKANQLQKQTLTQCARFLKRRILAEQDSLHLEKNLESILTEAQTIFSITKDEIQSMLAVMTEDTAIKKEGDALICHRPALS